MGRNWAIHLTLYDMSWRLEVYFLWLIPFIGIGILQQLVNMFICADGISSWGAMNQFDLLCRTLVCRFAPHSDWSPYHCCFQQISTHGALQLISWGHFLSSAKFKFVVYCETHYLDFRTITMKISVCLHSPLKKMSFFATIASIRKKWCTLEAFFIPHSKMCCGCYCGQEPRTLSSIFGITLN